MSFRERLNLSLIPFLFSLFFLLLPINFKLAISSAAESFFLFPARFLKRELDYLRDLRRERDDLAQRLIALNQRLAMSNGSFEKAEINLLRAEIVGRDHTLRSFLIIDKGKRDGVREDQTALTPEGLVGRVLKAGENFSLIETFYSPHLHISVVNQRTKDVGIVRRKGRGWQDSFLALDYFSPGADVLVGDTLFTSGQGGIFPKGIKVGYVKSITPTREIFLEIVVVPVVSLLKIDGLYLLSREEKKERVEEKREMEKLLRELELKIPEFFRLR
ncbi:MAG: rod shape-determining protein MreC [candidate division WOR-3 bacterium]